MKKLLFVTAATSFIALTSCNNSGSGSSDPDVQRNLAADSIITKSFDKGDTTGLSAVIADNCVSHGEHGNMGKDSIIAMAAMMKSMKNNDMKTETLQKLANKEYVMGWYRMTGTSDGSMGMPKGPYDMHSIELTKYKDGKAIEHWEYVDAMEMMKMMGQEHGNMPKMDSMSTKQ